MIRKLNKRGIALVEYAVLLAFVVTIGTLFTSNALPSSIEAVLEKNNNYIGNSSAPKYEIDKGALQYKDALYSALDYLNNAPLLKTEKPLGWVLFKGDGKLDNFSYYADDKGNNTAYLYPNNFEQTIINNFNNGLVETLSSSGYKVVGGSVFYDIDGNVVYNNAKGGSDRIGGQGRYNYLALKNKATNETGYIVLCSDNKWHYTNTAPSNKSPENF